MPLLPTAAFANGSLQGAANLVSSTPAAHVRPRQLEDYDSGPHCNMWLLLAAGCSHTSVSATCTNSNKHIACVSGLTSMFDAPIASCTYGSIVMWSLWLGPFLDLTAKSDGRVSQRPCET